MENYVPKLLLSSAEGDLKNFYNAFISSGALASGGYCPTFDESYDGLVLCGGSDVDPFLYGQELNGAFEPDRKRDLYEIKLIRTFLNMKKPILGICRGMQILNVAFGGTLTQDLTEKVNRFHHGHADHVLYHPISAEKTSVLYDLYGEVFSVNSLHHEAVDRIGNGLKAVAWSETGFPEAVENTELKVYAVQFHPERLAYSFFSPQAVDGVPLLNYFIGICSNNYTK